MNMHNAEKLAGEVRAAFFEDNSPRKAFERIFNEKKITIKYVEDGERLKKEDDGWSIFLPTSTSPARDTFTIAHELGHIFLEHKLNQDDEIFRKVELDDIERAANAFAAELLMPKTLFKDKFEEFGNDIARVAKFFGVSQAAAMVRMSILGLRRA